LATNGVLDLGDQEIGQVLASAPPDQEGQVPPRAVCELIERVRSDQVDSGFRIGVMNAQGVTWRGLFDGGEQERTLSQKYFEQAEVLTQWPRVQRILRSLGEGYEAHARFEDDRAERRRQGLAE
jgi:hypothetical protein